MPNGLPKSSGTMNSRLSAVEAANIVDRAQEDASKDALDLLPLSILPLQTKALKRARLRKNIRLESVVELFADEGAGSGQIGCDKLYVHFGWEAGLDHPDQKLMTALGKLNSYDVFSLRITLRDLGIAVNDLSALQLSDAKKTQLNAYMKSFTAPLIRQIFGQGNTDVNDFDDMVAMFKSPDRAEALRNLRLMAEQLNIELHEVPKFLEDYGDIFLSLAYFQEILDGLIPRTRAFIGDLHELRAGYGLKLNAFFARGSQGLDQEICNIISSIAGRFDGFNTHSRTMWENINAESFEQTRKLISAHHMTVGGVLCGLSVKINGWEESFRGLTIEQQQRRRSEYILSEIRPGIDQIGALEASAHTIKTAPVCKVRGKINVTALACLSAIEALFAWYGSQVFMS